jgi:hypothetical protein
MTSVAAQACALVADLLKAGPRNASEIIAAAEGAKVSGRSIQRAANELGVVRTKAGFGAGWTWKLPEEAGPQPGSLLGNVGSSPQVEHEGAKVPDGKITARFADEQDAKVALRSEGDADGNDTVMLDRAKVIAARLRKLEDGRGKVAPIHAGDPRLLRWVAARISDPDLREAYDRAVTDIEGDGPVTAGYLDKFVTEVLTGTAAA